VGERLTWAGLDACRRRGEQAVVVLGHSDYYPRFGFSRADRRGLRCEFESPPEAFMALELVDGALDGVHGLVRYSEAFRNV
jgi:putative acetyltransferase